MQTKNYFCKSAGSSVIPTTGTHLTDEIGGISADATIYIEFYSDAGGVTPASATAGTVTIEATPLGNVFLKAADGDAVSAVSISSGDYTPPNLSGLIKRGRVAFSGITGAAYARVCFSVRTEESEA